MVFALTMATQDNDPLTFISIAALTANVVRHLNLNEEKQKDSDRDPHPGNADKEADADKRRYIEHRLRAISLWEKIASGK